MTERQPEDAGIERPPGLETCRRLGPRRKLGAAAAALLLLSAAVAACDSRASADGNADSNGARGHVKVGIPF